MESGITGIDTGSSADIGKCNVASTTTAKANAMR
jgi:hypothetical protein